MNNDLRALYEAHRPALLMAINEYAAAVHDASAHQSASKADIASSQALVALSKISRLIQSLLEAASPAPKPQKRSGGPAYTPERLKGKYLLMHNTDGEFGQATGWLFTRADVFYPDGSPAWVWRRASELLEPDLNRDAARYRLLRRGQYWSVIDGIGRVLRADELDAAVDEVANTKDGATS